MTLGQGHAAVPMPLHLAAAAIFVRAALVRRVLAPALNAGNVEDGVAAVAAPNLARTIHSVAVEVIRVHDEKI